jgi:hypothetical protein
VWDDSMKNIMWYIRYATISFMKWYNTQWSLYKAATVGTEPSATINAVLLVSGFKCISYILMG